MNVTFIAEAPTLRTDEQGVIRIAGTRVTLDTVIGAHHQGNTPADIARQYPTLDESEIYSTIGYYLRHRAQLDQYLNERQIEAEELRKRIEKEFPPKVTREELLARKKARDEASKS